MRGLYYRLKEHLYSDTIDPEILESKVKVLTYDLIGAILYSLVFSTVMAYLEFHIASKAIMVYGIAVSFLLVYIFNNKVSYRAVVYFMTAAVLVLYTTFIFFSGGSQSPYLISLITLTSSALWYLGKKQAIINAIISVVILAYVNIVSHLDIYSFPNEIPIPLREIHEFAAFTVFIQMYFTFIFIYEGRLLKVRRHASEQNKEIKAQNTLLNKYQIETTTQFVNLSSKKSVLDKSMKYAQKIQENFQPLESRMKEYLEDAFILYRPMADVGGDFVWVTKKDQYRIVIVADCTGHGVPAALITMLGHSILDQIILRQEILRPSNILSELDCQFNSTFHGNIPDGMDISILLFDELNQTFTFSAAKHTVLYVPKEGDSTLLKGNRYSIGGVLDQNSCNKTFDTFTATYQKGDKFYLYSDGFQDQFGGVLDKKYLRTKFIQFLENVSHYEMNEQRKLLDQEFNEWKGDASQTDDMLVVGIEL
ncbi:PP2C family protein-serine/threonine phosphatase [Sediminitomix flava]|uniref:Serine phosphatase RsbU (Regulator of sigma subunit) n=1 Tax=Sediminitomix flava TaxID=379075 RepID=A0A315ZHW7_SEDFL|nr:SpoIIE family protein phosphatase [Sediminitomix flava]PWJ44902.1 serine phosphatase RsbU (regulator of sigma subunit) [Sediminitomix flava]